MLSAQPSLTAAQVKSTLQATARPFPTTGGTAGIPTCTAPGTAAQDECYCTTTTCGAGMLDAHAALLAVNGVQAAISLTTTTPTAGQTVALDVELGRDVRPYRRDLRVDDPQRR